MNKHSYRLVFDRARGMCVPAAETTRSSGKTKAAGESAAPALGETFSLLGAVGTCGLLCLSSAATSTWAAPPIPRAAAVAPATAMPVLSTQPARTASNFGNVTVTQPSGTQLRVEQTSNRAIVNWDSFNIGAGNTVRFVQPDKGSTLNKVWDANPSVISGRIQANGEVLLQNTNGVIFAPTARVETGRFVATALRVAEDTYKAGLRGNTEFTPAFAGNDGDRDGFVSLERGAEITTAAGGDVLIFAPRVLNEGRIETPDGQTVLGAGRTVYLSASADPQQRGLLVGITPYTGNGVDNDHNTVTQAEARSYRVANGETVVAGSAASSTAGLVDKLNAIVAERGSINLVALAIRQNGLLQATTAVKGLNGSILLQSQAAVQAQPMQVAGRPVLAPQAAVLGEVTMGPQSVTQVLPDTTSSATQLDSETFNRSKVRVEGQRIFVAGGARLTVPSGRIELLASDNPTGSLAFNPAALEASDHSRDPSRIVVGAGATLDVAGLKDVPLPASRNQMSGRLFQIELADSPVQRNGVLYREEVFFDARKPPVVADVSGFYNTVARTAAELSTTGGDIQVRSDGGVAVDAQARLNIAGGSLHYGAGTINTSLVRSGAQCVGLDRADKAVRYDELGNSKARTEAGTAVLRSEAVAAYVEGKNAGNATMAGRRLYFAANVDAQAVNGPAQTGRSGATSAVARGGTLEFGTFNDVIPPLLASANLQAGPARRRPGSLFDDPLGAGVDEALQPTLVVSANQLLDAGLGGMKFNVAERMSVAEGTRLNLGAGGTFQVNASSVDIAGEIQAPSGRIELSTVRRDNLGANDINLGARARLDTAGTWVTEGSTPAATTATTRAGTNSGTNADTSADAGNPIAVNGGSVRLTSAGGLQAAAGATIDVSAGASRLGNTVTRGRAGSVTLAMNNGAIVGEPLPGSLSNWQARLAAFDFARGGSLSISGLPSITLGGNLADTALGEPLFNGSGFGSIALTTLGDVRLQSGLNLQLQLQNLDLATTPAAADTQAAAQGRFAAVTTLPLAAQRAAVSLSINGATAPDRVRGLPGSALLVEDGARVATEAGGSLRFTARRQLTVNGTLQAPAGTLELTLAGRRGGSDSGGVFDDTLGFDDTQSLWLGSSARLSVAGTAELATDRLGRSTGTVLGGGKISLTAERGYVVTQSGAQLDLRGHAATVLDASAPQPQLRSMPGGNLSISTAEGAHLGAQVQAQAADNRADGGTFTLAISLNGNERKTAGPAYSTLPREIVTTENAAGSSSAVTALQPGQALPPVLGNGSVALSNSFVKSAGFSQLDLRADDRMVLADNLQLQAQRSLVLNTPALKAEANTETALTAPYVALGDQRRTPGASFEQAPSASSGDATLRVDAALVDLFGSLALQGFKSSSLNATLDTAGGHTRRDGEVRFIGTTRGPQAVATGSLAFGGELQFTAGQSYASNLSSYRIEGLAGDSYLATYLPQGGSSSTAPLSAGATLSLRADWLDAGGVTRQPFGRIEAQADRLRVLEGAELSVSGEGQTVPLGTTVNATQWQYRATGLANADGSIKDLDATRNGDIRVLQQLPVAKGLVLNGKTLDLSPEARLSAAGGGQLLAWEFVAGVGGSTDALAAPGLFAVLPSRSFEFAPYDSEVMSGAAAALRAGSQIDITMAGSALAPGRYTLLPARYALLPGAVLVSLAADQGRAALTAPLVNDAGGATVAGAFTGINSRADGSSGSTRILVEPAATVLARSRIDTTAIDSLLQRNAQRLDRPEPTLGGDAGRITLQARQAVRLDPALNLGHSGGGRRGELDIAVAGQPLAIVDDINTVPAGLGESWSLLSARSLARSQAGSVLVGGTRSSGAALDDTVVTPLNTAVRLLATATPVSAQEVMLVARDELTLATGSSLTTEAAAAAAAARATNPDAVAVVVAGSRRSITVQGDAAHALVSPAERVEVLRSYAAGDKQGSSGELSVQAGAAIAGHSVDLGASLAQQLSPDAKLEADNLGLAANRLAVGLTGTPPTGTTALSGGLLEQLSKLKALNLTALSGIDFYGSHTLDLDRLNLDTPSLRGLGSTPGTVTLQAAEVSLRNSASPNTNTSTNTSADTSTDTSANTHTGTLNIVALPQSTESITGGLQLGAGTLQLAFTQAFLGSSGDIVFSGVGGLKAQGDLTLSAARITATTAAEHGVELPTGTLNIKNRDGARTLGEHQGSGAQLKFAATALTQDGFVDAPGGTLEFTAHSGALRLGAASRTSAAGYSVQASERFTVHAPAGRITASATAGNMEVAGRLDVSAPGDADAGTLRLQAPAGDIAVLPTAAFSGGGGAGTAVQQGRFSLDAATLNKPASGTPEGHIDSLAQKLDTGGFAGEVGLRLRQSNVVLEAATLRAARVAVASDTGSIRLAGVVDARAAAGGSVRLFAGGDLNLEGRIDARSTRAGANGGDVTLGSAQGSVKLGSAASIDASGDDAADGRIVLRAPRDEAASTVAIDSASGFNAGTQLQAAEVIAEAVRSYSGYTRLAQGLSGTNGTNNGTNNGTTLGQDSIAEDSAQFTAAAAPVWALTALGADPRVSLRSGVQVMASGDFTVAQDWNLALAQQPGFLTIRSAGPLQLAGSISDGFESASRPQATGQQAPTALIDGAAWSMRLVAGADLAAADPLATHANAAADLTLADNRLLRTTAGSIDLAASRDIRLGSGSTAITQGVVYVAGRPSTELGLLSLQFSAWEPQFTSHGGNLSLTAGRDVQGAPATQLFGAWFYRTGQRDQTQVGWWSAFDAFRQGIGSFGGGNIRVEAGRDALNLGVVSPTAALAAEVISSEAGVNTSAALPNVANGGDIHVNAGRDVLGGSYLLARGEGRLEAGGRLGAAAPTGDTVSTTGTLPLLGLMDGQWNLVARQDAQVGAVINPTVLPSASRDAGQGQRISNLDSGVYFTYAPTSSTSVTSQGGSVSWQPLRALGGGDYWATLAGSGPVPEQQNWTSKFPTALQYLPPIFNLKAMGGDISTSGESLVQFPSPAGQLSAYAQRNLNLTGTQVGVVALTVSDRRPDSLPSTLQPAPGDAETIDDFGPGALSPPTQARDVRFDGLHAANNTPVRLHAGADILFGRATDSGSVMLVLPKAADISAGGNIERLNVLVQHLSDDDATRITAGGSLLQGTKSGTGVIVAGPGTLELNAGQQLDLGGSRGVETVGNIYNPKLPAQGADLVLAAGTRATLDVDTFAQRYLTPAPVGSSATTLAQAAAQAYLAATGRDPASTDPDTQALRSRLEQSYARQIGLWGGADASAVQQRRAQLVASVKAALGLPAAPPATPGAAADVAYETALKQFKGLGRTTQVQIAEQMLAQLFASTYVAQGAPYAQLWQKAAAEAGVDPGVLSGPAYERVKRAVLFAELNVAGDLARSLPASARGGRQQTFNIGFMAADLSRLGSSFNFAGDIEMVASGVQTLNGGTITLLAPGGQINVGLPGTGGGNTGSLKGVVSYGRGGVAAFSNGDFQVNSQRVFVVGQGDITIWSSNGDIDAGRGANTNVSVPPLVAVRQADGSISFALPSVAVGSGIGILKPAVGQEQGDIGLYAPNGEVLALDAQIRAPGRITLAAEVVRGADNIKGGSVVGAPVVVPPVPFSLPTAAPSAGETQAAGAAAGGSAGLQQARERQSLLMVELLGLGLPADEENCNVGSTEEKAECDRRKKARAEPSGPRTTPATRN